MNLSGPTRSAFAWIGLFCVNVLGILPWAHIRFPVVDLAEMVYEVRRLQLGYVPHRDTFTHHFLGYLLPLHALGSLVPLTPFVLKATAVCLNFITAVLVWLILREVSRLNIAWLGALLTVTLGWFWGWHGYGLNVQSSLTPLIAAVLLCVVKACTQERRSSFYWATFWSGCLLTCDQRAVFFLVLPAIPFLFLPAFRQLRTVALAMLASIPAPLLGAWYLWQVDAWSDFLEQTVVFPLLYRNHGVPFAAGDVLSAGLGTWLGGETVAVPWMLAGLLLASAFEPRRSLRAVWLASVISATGYAVLGGRPYPNYFLVLGPITVVLMSLSVHYVAARWPALGKDSATVLLIFAVFCGIRPALLTFATGSVFLPPNESTINTVATYLRRHTSPKDGVLVWGFGPQIYVLSDRFRTFRDAGLLSIAGANFASSSSDDQKLVPRMVDEFNQYLALSPPKIIVIYGVTEATCPGMGVIQRNLDYRLNPALKTLRDVIDSSYRSDLVVEGSCDRAEILVLREQLSR